MKRWYQIDDAMLVVVSEVVKVFRGVARFEGGLTLA